MQPSEARHLLSLVASRFFPLFCKETPMVRKELKCQRCGHRFECEVLGEDEVQERTYAPPVTCPKCRSTLVEPIRTLR